MAPRKKKPTVDAALQKLRDVGSPELADAVTEALADAPGWKLRPPKDDTHPLWIERDVKARAIEKAKAEGTTVAEVVRQGLGKYLAGTFTPRKPARGGDKTTFSVRIPEELVAQVDAAAVDREGAGTKVNTRMIAAAYLREVYAPAPVSE